MSEPNHELTLTRVFNAPRDLVFKAWTDPKHLAQWWGPRAFTNPVCKLDLRVGGNLLIHMKAPDGTVYPMTGVFHEILPPEKLSFTSAVPDGQGGVFLEVLNSATFTESAGKTTLTLHAKVIRSSPTGENMLKGQRAGWSQSLEKLAALFPSDIADREIISTRLINFPRELVWDAWSKPEHLARWWGPNGFTNTFEVFNFEPCGIWRFVMHGPDCKNYQNESQFIEIIKPERIVLDHVCAPEFEITATFEDVAGKTNLIFRMLFKSAEVCTQLKPICVPCNEQNFDRLEAELSLMQKKA